MAGFKQIPLSMIAVGRVTSQMLWRRVRSNFESHEDRISDLESAPTIFPTGSVAKFAGSAAPTGWLLCDGSVLSRTTYADLFAIIGTSYNTGGEAGTEFRIPDGRGRAFIGAGAGTGLTSRAVGDRVGAETHTLSTAEIPSHTHAPTDPTHAHSGLYLIATGGGALEYHSTTNGTPETPTRTSNSSTTGITIADAGSGSAHANMQPSTVLNWIVKT